LTLIAILALALALAVVWRLTRFIVRLVLLGALIVVIASHLSGDTRHHPTATWPRSIPLGQRRQPPAPPVPRDPNGSDGSRQAHDRRTQLMIGDNTPVLTRPSARWAKAATAERRVLERKCGRLLRRRERVLAQLDPIGRTLDKIDERVALQAQMKETERKYAADTETRQEALIQF
jgi:hypothetical protein